MSFVVEEIPNSDFVYRQASPRERSGPKERRFPNESHFELRQGEIGLSVNWDKYISIEDNFIILSLTYGRKGNYLDHTIFKIFKYPVEFLRKIEKIDGVIHKPNFYGNPAPVGKPNNRAHSEIEYENDVEICLKLSDYCNKEFENAYCEFDTRSLNGKIDELRKLLNNTSFHKL